MSLPVPTRPLLALRTLPHLASPLHTTPPPSQAPRPPATQPASSARPNLPRAPTSQLDQLRRYPSHPLLQFFHHHAHLLPATLAHPPTTTRFTTAEGIATTRAAAASLSVPLPHAVHASDLGKDASGRSWLAAELRTKSSAQLHTLWYVLLRERNCLATSWEELGRVGARQAALMWGESLSRRNHRVRKSMARIKLVLNERRLALIQAQEQVRSGTELELGEDGRIDVDAEDGALFEAAAEGAEEVEPVESQLGDAEGGRQPLDQRKEQEVPKV